MNNDKLRNLDVHNLLYGLKAARTVEAYTRHWAKYLAFAGDKPIAASETLMAWRQHLIADTKETPNTINLRLNSVKAIFRELKSRKMVNREVSWAMSEVKPLKASALPGRRSPNARVRIKPEQMRTLVNTPVISLSDPQSARDRALLMLLATSAVRISEAIAVRVRDIQHMDGNYFIANIIGKGQSEARVAPLSSEAYLAIQDWLFMRPTQSDYVFTSLAYNNDGVLFSGTPITRSCAYHAVKRVAGEAGMPTVKPHDFRRFVGTQLAKKDIRQAQRVLGHKSIETTAKHYVLDDVPLGSTEGLF